MKKLKKYSILSASILVITVITSLSIKMFAGGSLVNEKGTSNSDVTNNTSSKWVEGYYVAYDRNSLPPNEIDFTGLTQIVMGRIKANANGTINEDFDIGNAEGAKIANEVRDLAHKAGKKAILMLGGEGNGDNIRASVNSNTNEFVKNLVATVDKYGYDGIDVDWEENTGLDNQDGSVLIPFLKKLDEAMPDKIITFPIGAINKNYQKANPVVKDMAKYVDQLNIMSYYPATCMTGDGWPVSHNSPLKGSAPVTIENTLNSYASIGVSREKLGMGISFYAIGYTGSVTAPGQSSSGSSIVGGDNDFPLSKLFGSNGVYNENYKKWDSTAECSYLSLPLADKQFGCKYISFEDEQSILAKGKFCKDNGYGGIIIWTLNEGNVKDSLGRNFIMQALKKGFIDSTDNPEYTVKPTVNPTDKPTVKPTITPTDKPTVKPTDKPTVKPTNKPNTKPKPKKMNFKSFFNWFYNLFK